MFTSFVSPYLHKPIYHELLAGKVEFRTGISFITIIGSDGLLVPIAIATTSFQTVKVAKGGRKSR